MEVQMSAMPQSESSADSLLANPSVKAPAVRPADLKNDRFPNGRSSLGKRALLALVRFLIIFCIGVAATLAWQSYGDAAKMIASSYPQLGWLAPQAEPVAQSAPDVITLAAPTAPSPDQPNVMSLDLDAVRQSIDQLATSIAASQEQITRSVDRIAPSIVAGQEQITRSVDQLVAGQEQMTREITKLQEIEQSIRYKNSEPSPRPASASAPRPVPRPASASAPKPVPRPSPAPTVP
jgi:hypothetical protein